MALALYDRVQQTGTANTTVSFTLSGSVAGYQDFTVVGNGNTTYYSATDASGNWEVGIGTYSTTGPTLTRTTILSSSNSGSAETFSGTVTVFVTYPAEKSVNYDGDGVVTIGSDLSYTDTGIIASFVSTVAGYNQVVVQNLSSATNASANINVSNDVSTGSAGYAELGINSSTFTGSGCFNIAGASYLVSASTDLSLGTYGPYNIHFATDSSTTDAMTIFDNGGVSLGGADNAGLGALSANNVFVAYTTITAAAGTTVLTNASSGHQQVVGTTTQNIQLPVATTLLTGLAFTIGNNSTGAVLIKNNAGTTLDTVVTGGTAIMVLTDNSTSSGTWVAYSYLPASYDFSTSTASFGSASITNATWTGTTIAYNYGGTGLTTFGAANYALYSTSATALTAGTLPVQAGGTGLTAVTAGYIPFGLNSSALNTSANLFWDNTNAYLGIQDSTPGVALDVGGTIRSASATITSSATITPTAGTTNQYTVTALATNPTIAIPSGTPQDGQKLIIRIKDNGSARTLTWTTTSGGYRAVGGTLPSTTVAGKVLYVGCIYNSQDVFWDVVSSAQQT